MTPSERVSINPVEEKKPAARSKVVAGLSALALPALGALSCNVVPRAPEQARADVLRGALSVAEDAHFSQPCLKVVSLNTWGKPKFITGLSSERFEDVAHFLKREEIDVVALQEVWFEEARKIFLSLEGVDVAESPFRNSLFLKNGLATISRFPILESLSYRFTAESGVQALAEKGALYTALQLSADEHMHVWNVHLQSGDSSTTIREEQIRELCEWIEEQDDGSPLLILGDFNCAPGSEAFDQLLLALQNMGHIEVSSVGTTYDPERNVYALGETPLTLDFVISVTRSTQQEVSFHFDRIFDESEVVSDHFGVLSEITFSDSLDTRLAQGLAARILEEPKE